MSNPLEVILKEQPFVIYYPLYGDLMGSPEGGLVLSQLLHWGRSKNPFWKSAREFCFETGLSERTFERVKRDLKRMPFLRIYARGVPRTTHYKINYKACLEALEDMLSCDAGRRSIAPVRGNQYPRLGDTSIPKKGRLITTIHNDTQTVATPPGPRDRKSKIPQIWHRLAQQLSDAISGTRKINRTSIPVGWGNELRKIYKLDKIKIDAIKKVLKWYVSVIKEEGNVHNLNRLYIPVAESGTTFRKKFSRIQAAMCRQQGFELANEPSVKIKQKVQKSRSANESWD